MSQDDKKAVAGLGDRNTAQNRRTYKSPVLQRFGALSRLTQGSGGKGNDAGVNKTKMSDRSLKQNIVHIGTLPIGINLYLFNYLDTARHVERRDRQLGVMADEVEKVMPEAVSVHTSGYKMVNYELLNIRPDDVAAAFIHY